MASEVNVTNDTGVEKDFYEEQICDVAENMPENENEKKEIEAITFDSDVNTLDLKNDTKTNDQECFIQDIEENDNTANPNSDCIQHNDGTDHEATEMVEINHSISNDDDNQTTLHISIDNDVTISNEDKPSNLPEKEFLLNHMRNGDVNVLIENKEKYMRYRISDTPPFHLCLLFALQQCLLSLPSCVKNTVIVAEVMCARDEELFKAKLLSMSLLMSGLCTFFQNTIGVRLPVYQGPVSQYVIPLLLLLELPEFSCPPRHADMQSNDLMNISFGLNASFPATNVTMPEDYLSEVVLPRFRMMSGSLLVAGAIHTLIGATGMVGILLRFIGPITVIPTILLVGLNAFSVVTKFCQSHWGIAVLTAGVTLILSMYLDRRKMPIMIWSRKKGFHIIYYPLHQVLAVLFAVLIGWTVSAIMTATGSLSSDKNSQQYYARTDSRMYVVRESSWFTFPYPGMYGFPSFSSGIFVAFLTATITSVIDSIADYYACARVARVPPPPQPAVNRGIMIEGIFSLLAGAWGAGHATTTYGGNIGVVGITKVASRQVFQLFAILLVICGILGKVGGIFVTIPYPVLGGTQLIGFGIFIGLVLSNLQFIDLQSTRNLAIIGISILVGLMIPHWTKMNSDVIDTGNVQLDNLIKMLMTNPNFTGGLLSCFLDNTVPGTLKERGMLGWQSGDFSEGETETDYCEGLEVYEIPSWTAKLKKYNFSRYIPIFPTYNPSKSSKHTD